MDETVDTLNQKLKDVNILLELTKEQLVSWQQKFEDLQLDQITKNSQKDKEWFQMKAQIALLEIQLSRIKGELQMEKANHERYVGMKDKNESNYKELIDKNNKEIKSLRVENKKFQFQNKKLERIQKNINELEKKNLTMNDMNEKLKSMARNLDKGLKDSRKEAALLKQQLSAARCEIVKIKNDVKKRDQGLREELLKLVNKVENIESVENVEKVESVEKIEKVEKVENVENVGDLEVIDNIQNVNLTEH